MIVMILILTAFNTGLIILLAGCAIYTLRKDMTDIAIQMVKHSDESIEAATTAIYNMDSLKQKAKMSGRADLG